MLPILVVVALVSLLSVNAFISRRAKKRGGPDAPRVDPATMAIVERVWMDVADARGLRVDDASVLAVRGDIDGVPCEMELGEDADGLRTIARAHRLPETTAELSVAPRDLRERALSALRGKRPLTGDDAFDEAFVCDSKPAALASRAVDEKARETLLSLRTRSPRLSFDGSTVELSLAGAEIVHEHLEAIFDLLVKVAGADTDSQPGSASG